MRPEAVVDYGEIEGLPVSTAPGHEGRFIFGEVAGVPCVLLRGRVHLYEGYSPEEAVMPVRLAGLLGAKALVLTNAAGGVCESFTPGDLMLISDHIACFCPSPLIGPNPDALGPRFPDMSEVYDGELRDCFRRAAGGLGIELKEGVYIQLRGPQYETPAEIRMSRLLGASAVGMSTAIEAVAARHMGLRVAGVSCITNMAAGVSKKPLSAEEVFETADRVGETFAALLRAAVPEIAGVLADG